MTAIHQCLGPSGQIPVCLRSQRVRHHAIYRRASNTKLGGWLRPLPSADQSRRYQGISFSRRSPRFARPWGAFVQAKLAVGHRSEDAVPFFDVVRTFGIRMTGLKKKCICRPKKSLSNIYLTICFCHSTVSVFEINHDFRKGKLWINQGLIWTRIVEV